MLGIAGPVLVVLTFCAWYGLLYGLIKGIYDL